MSPREMEHVLDTLAARGVLVRMEAGRLFAGTDNGEPVPDDACAFLKEHRDAVASLLSDPERPARLERAEKAHRWESGPLASQVAAACRPAAGHTPSRFDDPAFCLAADAAHAPVAAALDAWIDSGSDEDRQAVQEAGSDFLAALSRAARRAARGAHLPEGSPA